MPDLLRHLREAQAEQHVHPLGERLALRGWAWLARQPRWYSLATRLAARYLKWLGGREQRIRVLGIAPEWTQGRDLPAAPGRTFRELYAQQRKRG